MIDWNYQIKTRITMKLPFYLIVTFQWDKSSSNIVFMIKIKVKIKNKKKTVDDILLHIKSVINVNFLSFGHWKYAKCEFQIDGYYLLIKVKIKIRNGMMTIAFKSNQ